MNFIFLIQKPIQMNSGLARIDPQTKISALIKANEMVIDALADLNPHFNKLRNAVLRKLLAGRVTIEDACRISGCKVEDFLLKMAEIGFEIGNSTPEVSESITENKPAIFQNLEEVVLDVRPMLARGEDPLKAITKTTNTLGDKQCLKLINTFEPIPLISLLFKKGFTHHTERLQPDLVITWFVKAGKESLVNHEVGIKSGANKAEFDLKLKSFAPHKLETIDVRGLEMPQPMITILSHLENLAPDKALFVLHKKIPVYLLPELQDRGFSYALREVEDGKVDMLIYKS